MRRELNHVYGAVLLALCSPLANYLVSFPTPALPLGLLHMRLFAKLDSSAKEYDIYYGVMPTFSDPQGAFLLVWSWGDFLYLRSDRYVIFPVCSLRAQFPPLTLSLGCQGKQSSNLLCLTNSGCSAQRPIYLLPQTCVNGERF